jgi:hypothetical protein
MTTDNARHGYAFRLRFTLASSCRLPFNQVEHVLATSPAPVILRAGRRGQRLDEASAGVVTADHFDDPELAREAGVHWRTVLQVAFLEHEVGADFGSDTLDDPRVVQIGGTESLHDETGLRVLNDADPRLFHTLEMSVHRSPDAASLASAIASSKEPDGQHPTTEWRTAFALWSAASDTTSPQFRLLALVSALETMAPAGRKSDPAQEFLDETIARLPDGLRRELSGGLAALKKQSTGTAVRALLEQAVGTDLVSGQRARRLWQQAYDLRSDLTHGRRAVTRTEVDDVIGPMHELVRQVLLRARPSSDPREVLE